MDTDWPVPIVDSDHCDGCGLCVKACPNGALAVEAALAKAFVAQPKACQYTGHCVTMCPHQAITLQYKIVPDNLNGTS